MSNEIREKLKPEIDKTIHDWILRTHDQFDLTQKEMSSILEMDPRSYAAIEAMEHSCGLLTFLIYLFRLCHDSPAFLGELNKKIDKLVPIHPEMIPTREWMYQENRWTKESVKMSPITGDHLCPKCGAPIARDFQNFCGNCAQSLDWSEVDADTQRQESLAQPHSTR